MAEKRDAGKPVFGQWQPTETAPRDGTQFLAAFEKDVFLVRWDPCWEMGPTFPSPPDFWMPLPKPPARTETMT
jgi:hypothetical protein